MAQAQKLIQSPIKTQFVNELTSSSLVDSLFVLSYKDSRISSNAGRYLALELKDRSGSIRAFQFDRSQFADVPPVGSVVHVSGLVEGKGTKKRIKVSSLEAAYDYSPHDFIAVALRPISEMREEFSRVLMSLKRKSYVQLARKILGSKEFFERFLDAPAQLEGPGACRGGAIEQSLKLARLVDTLCQVYPQANRDELLVAALTHLVGAVDAFDFDTSISKTKAGEKLDPIYLSSLRLQKVATLANARGNEAVLSLHELFANLRNAEPSSERLELVILAQAYTALQSCEEAEAQQASRKQAGY